MSGAHSSPVLVPLMGGGNGGSRWIPFASLPANLKANIGADSGPPIRQSYFCTQLNVSSDLLPLISHPIAKLWLTCNHKDCRVSLLNDGLVFPGPFVDAIFPPKSLQMLWIALNKENTDGMVRLIHGAFPPLKLMVSDSSRGPHLLTPSNKHVLQ